MHSSVTFSLWLAVDAVKLNVYIEKISKSSAVEWKNTFFLLSHVLYGFFFSITNDL